MAPISHDEFFSKLAELFASRKSKDHGSIYLTQKRFTRDQKPPQPIESEQFPDLHPESPLPLLVRASNGKSKERRADKIQLSTLVEPGALDTFYARYAEVCKGGMTALKPRDRSKRKAKTKKRKAPVGSGAGATSMKAVQ